MAEGRLLDTNGEGRYPTTLSVYLYFDLSEKFPSIDCLLYWSFLARSLPTFSLVPLARPD